jgi:anaerobic selenocysteine-containing dehydrogenase
VNEDDWVFIETAGGPGQSRALVRLTDEVPPGVVSTGMGWWYPESEGPLFGATEVNINAAMRYGGPCDPVSGSVDSRGLRCRVERAEA